MLERALGSAEPAVLAGDPLALVAEDGEAVLLAPSPGPAGWLGFLICSSFAAGQERLFRAVPGGREQRLVVPIPPEKGAVMAVEGACLPTP